MKAGWYGRLLEHTRPVTSDDWLRWYTSWLPWHGYESLSLDYDAPRIYRLQVRALFEEARRACFKAAWARYRASGELNIWTV